MITALTERLPLNDGHSIPAIGLGVYKAKAGECVASVLHALKIGYRHIDTAAFYENEAAVGEAVRKSGIPRDQIFVTTKLWNDDHGYEKAITACHESLKRLGLEFIDLYLIHSPVAGKRVETWRALMDLQKQGKCRSIGVSNYGVHHIEELLQANLTKPAVNQIEMHPFLQQREIRAYCAEQKILVEAYSPLTRGQMLTDPRVLVMAEKHGKTPAQILIRWCVDQHAVPLPKSTHVQRIEENMDIGGGWSLSKQDLQEMESWDQNLHICWNPLEWA